MTTVRIAHVEPWPGKRGLRGHGFRVSSFLVVLADDAGGRALPVWLNGPEGHGLLHGDGGHPHPEPAEAITAELLRSAGVAVTGVGIDELDAALTAGPRHGRDGPRSPARIEFTAAGTGGSGQMTARIGYALALAAATGAPIQVADQVMERLAVPAQDDPVGQFTRDVPLPRPKHHRFARLFRGHPRTA
jgi:bifunctional DNase/RNase